LKSVAALRDLAMNNFEFTHAQSSLLYSFALLINIIQILKYGHLSNIITELIFLEIDRLLDFLIDYEG